MIAEVLNCYVGIFSARRPSQVPVMQGFVPEVTWYVADEEDVDAYTQAGAKKVEIGGLLCPSRNAVLEGARKAGAEWCLQLSDDLKGLRRAVTNSRADAYDIDMRGAVSLVREAMIATKARLGGVAPTANAFYYNANRPLHTKAFILGDFMLTASDCDLRFDEGLRLKEDYDFTLQHLKRWGVVARRNDVLADFAHRSNSGGAVRYRTPETEQAAIAHLKRKWGKRIRDNRKRPNEILLDLR